MTSLRERLHRGEVLVGTFCCIPHPAAVEITGMSGFDFLVIDGEHAAIDRSTIENLVRAAETVRVPAMFRVPGLEGEWIASVLDAGAQGVLVPRVETAAQARAAVASVRYPPAGKRGVGPGRAAGYGLRIEEYLASANSTLLLAIQVETQTGLLNIDEIAAVEGVDTVYIGPGDLAVSIDALGPEGRPKLEQAISTIIDTCQRRGRLAGIFHMSVDTLPAAVNRGLRFHTVGSDSVFLREAAARSAQAMRAQR